MLQNGLVTVSCPQVGWVPTFRKDPKHGLGLSTSHEEGSLSFGMAVLFLFLTGPESRDMAVENEPESPLLWGELAELCREVHDLLYVGNNPNEARKRVRDLERILNELLSNSEASEAIVYWDAMALVAELKGQLGAAAEHRRHEIELMLKLHRLVEDGKDSPSVLVGRDTACLEVRRKIRRALLRTCGEE